LKKSCWETISGGKKEEWGREKRHANIRTRRALEIPGLQQYPEYGGTKKKSGGNKHIKKSKNTKNGKEQRNKKKKKKGKTRLNVNNDILKSTPTGKKHKKSHTTLLRVGVKN